MEDGAVLNELSKEGTEPITYEGEAEEIAGAERITLSSVTALESEIPQNDLETVTTYLFASDAEGYTPAKLQLKTNTVAGIIENNIGEGGYQSSRASSSRDGSFSASSWNLT